MAQPRTGPPCEPSGSPDPRSGGALAGTVRTVKLTMTALALTALLLTGCGDDADDRVDTGAPAVTSTIPAASAPSTTTSPSTTTTVADDVGSQPGIEEFTAQCREGDAEGCRQLTDATLGEICDEGQTVACQVTGARVGEGDPDGDGTVPFEEGCRAGEFEDCAELSDATLQTICDEGQTAACQTYLARTGEGGE